MCCVKFCTETNYSSATSGIVHLLLGMILSGKVMSLKHSALKRFCCDTSLNAKHPGEFWRKMKPLLPTSSGKNIQGVILVEGSSVVSDPGCVAEVFSDYFANIIQLEHRSDTDYTDHPSIKAISNLRFSSEFNYSPVSTSYNRNILDPP